ncbi:MAG: hypothetical protein KDI36_01380 [Pseudomonadales bacterium]|nr:hypothetical protein [Pseudomonadales bacterium]
MKVTGAVSRRELLQMLALAGAGCALHGCAVTDSSARKSAMIMAMPEPAEMPDYMSIYQYMGNARINDEPVTLETRVREGDVIETAADSELVFVLKKDAFQLKPNTRIRLPAAMEGGAYALETGAALGVFASRRMEVRTPDAVISIRGTAVYAEVLEDRSYICTCYGETLTTSAHDSGQSARVKSRHHDAPKEFLRTPDSNGQFILPSVYRNHEDKSLMMMETLVGRQMPV